MKKLLTVLLTIVMAIGLVVLNNNHTKAEGNAITDPFCITAEEAGAEVSIKTIGSYTTAEYPKLQYEIYIGGTWSQPSNYDFSLPTKIILPSKGDKVRFTVTENGKFSKANGDDSLEFVFSKDVSLSGNIMSLVYKTDQLDQAAAKIIPCDHCFDSLFYESENVVSIDNLLLPATTLTEYCYDAMFDKCKNIKNIPDNFLPATVMKSMCYANMFIETGITTIPENLLPAGKGGVGNLADTCYNAMFQDCKSLTTLPAKLLPATTIGDNTGYSEYEWMFYGCSGLTSIPDNFLPATTLTDYCYDYMFCGCTSLTSIPENLLPATTLTDGCYKGMFEGCTNLHLSSTKPSKYDNEFRIPYTGAIVGTPGADALTDMFKDTGGNIASTPSTETTYYVYQPEPTPSPSPSKKDESCEKVIGPTWHWNNTKGVCEEYATVGTSTR